MFYVTLILITLLIGIPSILAYAKIIANSDCEQIRNGAGCPFNYSHSCKGCPFNKPLDKE